MDDMDLCQQINQELIDDALKAHKLRTWQGHSSATECAVCGEEIPEARRQAMPGCPKCITYQTEYEQMHGR